MRVWTFSSRSGYVPYDQWKRAPEGGGDEEGRQANGFQPVASVVLGAVRDETAPLVSIYARDVGRRAEHIADYLVEVALGDTAELVLCDRFPDLLQLLNQLAPIIQAGLGTSVQWGISEVEGHLGEPEGNGSDAT